METMPTDAHRPPATVDQEAFTVSRTIRIGAAQDKVWAAITEPEHIARWAGQEATLSALEVGGTATWTWDEYGATPLVIEELDPPRMIAYRWASPGDTEIDPNRSTVFRFTFEPDGTDTVLTVVESGFETLADPSAAMEDNRGGWTSELDELATYLERRR